MSGEWRRPALMRNIMFAWWAHAKATHHPYVGYNHYPYIGVLWVYLWPIAIRFSYNWLRTE